MIFACVEWLQLRFDFSFFFSRNNQRNKQENKLLPGGGGTLDAGEGAVAVVEMGKMRREKSAQTCLMQKSKFQIRIHVI